MRPDRDISRRWLWLAVAVCAIALNAAKPSLAGADSGTVRAASARP
jgi:hypothetical protein